MRSLILVLMLAACGDDNDTVECSDAVKASLHVSRCEPICMNAVPHGSDFPICDVRDDFGDLHVCQEIGKPLHDADNVLGCCAHYAGDTIRWRACE